MAKKLKTAVYGACHADALQAVLYAHPDIRNVIDFMPLAPCMSITEAEMCEFERALSVLDFLIYQPISLASRGERFATASLLCGLRPGAAAISFPYFHFELYTPFVTAPHLSLPAAPHDYVDYLLATLIVRGETDTTIVDRLQTFDGCDEHASLMRGASMYELEAREQRILPGDRPLDVRVLDRVRAKHTEERLCHTNNHPGATVMGWIGDDVAGLLRTMIGLSVTPPPTAKDRPDPLCDIDFPAHAFVRKAFSLVFVDSLVVKLLDGTLELTE